MLLLELSKRKYSHYRKKTFYWLEMLIVRVYKKSWENTLNIAEQSAPLLFGILKGTVTTKQNENTLVRGNRVQLKPKIGTALAFYAPC